MVDRKNHEMMSESGEETGINRDGPPEAVESAQPERDEKATGDEAVGAPLSAATRAEPEAQRPISGVAPPAGGGAAPAPQPPSGGMGRSLGAGILGGAIVSAVAFAALNQFPPKAELSQADLGRIVAAETAAAHDADAIAGLDKRIGALEAAKAAAAAKLDAGEHAVQAVTGDVKTLRSDVDAARGTIAPLSTRLDKLEKDAAAASDVAAVAGRVQKLETVAAAPKPPGDNASAVVILAETIRDKLTSGAPFGGELSALAGLGVDPARLAVLKPLAEGAPTSAALAASFEAAEPKIAAAVAPKDSGSVQERFLAHVRSLVQIHPVGETAGEDPQAVSTQVLADLQRGDLGRALAAFAKLPEPAREAASGFAAAAKSKQEAAAAAQAIRDAAVARIAAVKP